MRVCTICGAKWRGEPTVCPLDGGALAALPDPLIGRTIGGRYVITRPIGKGGMGTVYRAQHEVVGRDVAIKFLSPDLAMEPNNRRRFLREAKAANRIDHEHIIDITDFGETDDGLVYLVMEYLDGEPLSSVIERGPLPMYRAVDIAMQMSAALARAHELDVVHRDIKPENVFVLRRSVGGDFVKLLDFGLAKMKGEMRLTASGAVFGTPEYMAPEQARGAPLTGKADLYALGCVLYEMLVGAPPFSGTAPDLILKHIREPAPPLARHLPDAPPPLAALVARLLEKDPARRHGDAYHVFEELRAIANGVPRPSSVPRPRDLDLAETIRQEDAPKISADLRRALAERPPPAADPAPSPSTPDLWSARIARFRELAGIAHPSGPPAWLAQHLRALEADLGVLTARRRELDDSAAKARQHEEDTRHARLRLGRAIDILGRDESRAARELEELGPELEQARRRLAALEPALRGAWEAIEPAPPGALEASAVDAVRRAGDLAGRWMDAYTAAESLAGEVRRRERERDDLRFQIAQLKGRLGTMSAEVDYDLSALRERARALDEELSAILDRMARLSEEILKYLVGFPALSDAVRAVSGGR